MSNWTGDVNKCCPRSSPILCSFSSRSLPTNINGWGKLESKNFKRNIERWWQVLPVPDRSSSSPYASWHQGKIRTWWVLLDYAIPVIVKMVKGRKQMLATVLNWVSIYTKPISMQELTSRVYLTVFATLIAKSVIHEIYIFISLPGRIQVTEHHTSRKKQDTIM